MVKLLLATIFAISLPLGMAAIAQDHHGGPGGGGGHEHGDFHGGGGWDHDHDHDHDHDGGWHGGEHHGWHHGDRDEGFEGDWHREDNCWRWLGFIWVRVC